MVNKILITGAGGLIGSEAVEQFCRKGYEVYGLENDGRAAYFGEAASTKPQHEQLIRKFRNYIPFKLDIRYRGAVESLISGIKPSAIIHTAAQPSHDWAASDPHTDFEVNATGTLNLLEAARGLHVAGHPITFINFSSNKVYGDAPNHLSLIEQETRYDYTRSLLFPNVGIDETMSIDQSKHSLFGCSKVAADLYVQEYGRYFGMNTVCLRAGCLTGASHAGCEAHGFLNYLIKCNKTGKKYTIYGYKGKQVRDNIDAYDVVRFVETFLDSPRVAAVYNLGGGRENSISILEAFALAEEVTGKKMIYEYVDKPREGDHICYISDLTKIKRDYPTWTITKNLKQIFTEIANG